MALQAVVVGGGIGGLAAAVALESIGLRTVVCERAPEVREVGAGLTLWSNAIASLDRLGLARRVVELSETVERVRTWSHRGRPLAETPVGELSRRAGWPTVCVHRADLQRVLAEALPAGRIRTGWCFERLELHGGGVSARSADGRTERGELLIGADGLRSAVRAQLFGASEPRYAGYTAWRGIARPADPAAVVPRGEAAFYVGPGTQIGIFHCGGGRLYWFATRNAPRGTDAQPGEKRPRLQAAFAGWPAPVLAAVEATEEAAVLANDILDRPPTPGWTQGPVALLGDAVHATTPNLGQGACMAIEDAVVLADCLRRPEAPGDLAGALALYADRRRDRTAMVIRESWELGRVLQWQNGLAVRAREWLFGLPAARRGAEDLFDRLLGWRPPLERSRPPGWD